MSDHNVDTAGRQYLTITVSHKKVKGKAIPVTGSGGP
jgi:hypothetical protein